MKPESGHQYCKIWAEVKNHEVEGSIYARARPQLCPGAHCFVDMVLISRSRDLSDRSSVQDFTKT